MPKAVKFDNYGGLEVLQVRDVERPTPGRGGVLVRVKATGINPGEATIREGGMAKMFPATFPSGEGTDFAGVVEEVGEGVSAFKIGDEVVGYTHDRAAHAELVAVGADHLTPKPASVPWEQAGALFVAGTTAYSCVRAVSLKTGDTVVVSGAAGGVGSLIVQLAKLRGAKVIGLASEANHKWLSEHGAIPVAYGSGMAERIRAAAGARIDAFIDTFGKGYVELALELGVVAERINTIIDFGAVQKHKVKAEGSAQSANGEVLAELVGLMGQGQLEVPVAKTFPLSRVRDAFQELMQRHTHGKIVLIP
jgi:NADPH:quinone reductase-like Zn-dependent oxidoreductase